MWGEQLAKVIAAFPPLIWALLVGYIVWQLRETIQDTLRSISNVDAFGFKVTVLKSSGAMNAAIELAKKHTDWQVDVPEVDRSRAVERAFNERALLEGAEILWVDDRPANNRNEVRMLASFGALITCACTTDEALRALEDGAQHHQPFHLIISDIDRAFPVPDSRAGISMLPVIRAQKHFQPVILYVGQYNAEAGVPPAAFGITHRPDELLQLSLDALARVRSLKRD